jgi:hypothetical protein
MTNQPLPDDDHISRYCKPSTVDDGIPMFTAFIPRQDEDHLSVNWLEYFGETELNAAVERVREVFHSKGFTLRPNGRFAVLNVEAARTAVHEAVGRTLNIDHLPLSDDPSHSGILGYSSEDLAVAVELAALITPQDIHQAVP